MRSRRLALVTLSGVRIRNENLRRLGLTLPGFVERGRVIASLPTLALLILAARTPPTWEPSLHELDEINETAFAALATGEFDLVAISALSARIREAYALADRLRSGGVKVVLGGLHVSALPREAMAHADAVVQGEAEEIWPELIGDFEAGRLRPLYSSLSPVARSAPIDTGPLPRYDLLDPGRYNRITLQTTRGCPLHCSFCAASRTISPYKVKPVARVRAELEAILDRWPRPFLELADDNTFVHKAWSRELVRMLGEYPLKWFTETDVSIADDEALLEGLARSGCAQILVGFESAHREALRGADTRDWKYARFDGTLERIRRIQSYGISVNGCFVLGFDADGPDVFDRTLEFVRESDLAEVQITLLTPFPGTALYQSLADQDRLLWKDPWDRCTLFDVTFRPARMSVEELETGFLDLMGRLYSTAEVERRRRRFRSCARSALRRRAGTEKPPEETT